MPCHPLVCPRLDTHRHIVATSAISTVRYPPLTPPPHPSSALLRHAPQSGDGVQHSRLLSSTVAGLARGGRGCGCGCSASLMFSRRKEGVSSHSMPALSHAMTDPDDAVDERADLIRSSSPPSHPFTSPSALLRALRSSPPLSIASLLVSLLLLALVLVSILPSFLSSDSPLPLPSTSLPLLCCPTTRYHPRLQIVTVGDSITDYGGRVDGWVTLLSAHYLRKADVFNRGYGGYNTEDFLHLLPQHLAHHTFPYTPTPSPPPSSPSPTTPPHISASSLSTLGTNDAARDMTTPEPRQHVSLPDFRHNLLRLITLLIPDYSPFLTPLTPSPSYLSSHTALILITPTQMDPLAWAHRNADPPYPDTPLSTLGRTNEATLRYVEVVREVAALWSVPLLDLWERTGAVDGKWRHLDRDGLHLSAEGNRVVYEGLMEVVSDKYPQLQPAELLQDAPLYTEIDRRNASATFNEFRNSLYAGRGT